MLKKAGFDSIDYSYYWLPEEDEALGESYREYAGKVKEYLEKNNMTCNQAHAPLALKYGAVLDVEDPEYLKLVRSIESAAILGAESIIVHALKVPSEVDLFAYNVAFYKGLEKYCRQFHICIAIENLFWQDKKSNCLRGLFTPEQLNEMIAVLDSPYFVICVDVGHAAITGYEPQDMIRQFDSKNLKALHIHDNDYYRDRHTLPYTGLLDWGQITQALHDIGYQGDFTLEIFGYLLKVDDAFMETALDFAAKTGRFLIESIRIGKR
jgi:sugar phosphate isomerase/epimerase